MLLNKYGKKLMKMTIFWDVEDSHANNQQTADSYQAAFHVHLPGYLLGLPFDPEGRGITFL
jgi:hypothetical protein